MHSYFPEEIVDSLTEAIEKGDIATVKRMISQDVQLKDCLIDDDGYNILMLAAAVGNLEIVTYLIDIGADPNSTAPGECPLLSAMCNDHQEIVDFLLPLTSEELIKLAQEDILVDS